MVTVYIGVGTNVEREKHARAAITELSHLDAELKVSTIYECEPVGFDSEPFFNFVIKLETSKKLTLLSHVLHNIEVKWGRSVEAKKFQDRNLDLDILLFGDEISLKSPIVPRDDIYKYPFVIQPLYELAPDLVIPNDGRTVREIWDAMDNLESLSKVDSDFLMDM